MDNKSGEFGFGRQVIIPSTVLLNKGKIEPMSPGAQLKFMVSGCLLPLPFSMLY